MTQLHFFFQVSAANIYPKCLFLALKHGAVLDAHHFPPEICNEPHMKNATCYSVLSCTISGSRLSSETHMKNVFQMWYILHEFGADFSFKNAIGLTPLQQLSEQRLPYNYSEIMLNKMRSIMNEVMSLQSLCRIKIRQCMGYDCHKNFHKLTCIPKPIQGFLNFDNFEVEVTEDQKC
jgi:hypothetical protein